MTVQQRASLRQRRKENGREEWPFPDFAHCSPGLPARISTVSRASPGRSHRRPLSISFTPLPRHPCTLLVFPIVRHRGPAPSLAGLRFCLGCACEERMLRPAPGQWLGSLAPSPGICIWTIPLVILKSARLKKQGRVQWTRTLESDKAEFKFNCYLCGLGPYLSFSESQSAHL